MSDMVAVAALPEPSTAVEHKLLLVLRAWLSTYVKYYEPRADGPVRKHEYRVFPWGAAGDLLHLMAAIVTDGPPRAVRSNSFVADGLRQSPEVFEALRPYIQLTPKALGEIVAAHIKAAESEAKAKGGAS